jgi:hypothetical protein
MKNNLRLAECCQTCAYCVREHPYDDPICYYCNLDNRQILEKNLETSTRIRIMIIQGKKTPETKAFLKQERKRIKWIEKHEVRAGNVCDDFRKKV